MSQQYPGGFIMANPTAPTSSAAPGIWTIDQAAYYKGQGLWPAAPGQDAYVTAGTFTWVAPAGVTSVSVVCVGAGQNGGGAGGALAYKNNITVVPGTSYTLRVAASNATNTSYFDYLGNGGTNVFAGRGSNRGGDGGGNGGIIANSSGGGAGGYSGNGGIGGNEGGTNISTAGSGGGGGGGTSGNVFGGGGGGGGVGLLGEGASGARGAVSANGSGGGGGSGGANGSSSGFSCCTGTFGGNGGLYGGGAGDTTQDDGIGGRGAVRIIWPGNTRSFPSTNTGNL
jgi:hypothetical protein